jgi:peroxiredoxin
MWNRRRVLQASAGLMLPALPALAVPSKPKVGAPAPEAELTLIDGKKIKLSEMRGDVVVLNIWATWCVPCRQELPLLDRYYALQKAHGLRVFALSTEDSVPIYKMKPLFATLSIQPTKKIKGPYGAIDNAVPSNYVIDRMGVLRYAKAAAFDLEDLNRELVPLLNEPRPA